MPDENGTGRLDRIERTLEALTVSFVRMREDHDRDYKQLMTARVLMQDNLRIIVENQAHFDHRVDRFVSAVGEFVHRRPANPPVA